MNHALFLYLACGNTVLFAFIAFVYLFGSNTSWWALRKVNSALIQLPVFLRDSIHSITPVPIYRLLSACCSELLYQRNPYIQIFYVILIGLGHAFYSVTTLPYVHRTIWGIIPFFILAFNLAMFAICSVKDAGVITSTSLKHYLTEYQYDTVMYGEGKVCPTCQRLKPARSKHCSLCNVCVARFDHHCSWVNNCIGRQNHKFFIAFLVSVVGMCLYAAFITSMVFLHIVHKRGLHLSSFVDGYGTVYPAHVTTVVLFLAGDYPFMWTFLLFLLFVGLAVFCFLVFHIYLILVNKTTNELMKHRKPRLQETRNDSQSSNGQREGCGEIINYNRGVWKNIAEVLVT